MKVVKSFTGIALRMEKNRGRGESVNNLKWLQREIQLFFVETGKCERAGIKKGGRGVLEVGRQQEKDDENY